jgi:NAD+ kinase
VALGGDGLMLETIHSVVSSDQAIFGMNRGSVGFLMNDFSADDLPARIEQASETVIHPLNMTVTGKDGERSLRTCLQRSLDAAPATPGGKAAHLD